MSPAIFDPNNLTQVKAAVGELEEVRSPRIAFASFPDAE